MRPLLIGFCAGPLCLLLSAAPACAEEGIDWGPWHVLLPIDHPDGAKAIAPKQPPEKELSRMRLDGPGPDLTRDWRGKLDREIVWRPARTGATPGIFDTGKVDFTKLLPAEYAPEERKGLTGNAVAFLYMRVTSDREEVMPAYLGSDDGCRIWFNGALIHEFNGGRGVNPESDIAYLELKQGVNHLFVKVNNGGGAWGFQMSVRPRELTPGLSNEQKAINAAIDRGVEYLLKAQQRDGSWAHEAGGYRNGMTSLALYALLKSGLKSDHQAIRRGFEYLRLRPPRKTYSAACQLLALVSAHREEYQEWIQEITDELVDWQMGSFAYPHGTCDLSNTQYGALGLWAAAKAGAKIPKRTWIDLARATLPYHNKDGGFGYRPAGKSTGAMTTAGVTVISICADHFGEKGFPAQWRKQLESARDAGLRWLGDNYRRDKNPEVGGGGSERWKHYYSYGLERLAALEGLDRFGVHDWYWEGSTYLIASQGEEGNWGTAHGEPEPNTAFGLLFLNRATASMTGGGPSLRQGRLYATDGEDVDIVLRAKGDTPINLWVSEIRPKAIETHGREGEKGRGIYVQSAEYFADGKSVGVVESDPTRAWNREPLAIQHRFEERGHHEVQVVLHLAPDPAASGGAAKTLKSPVLKVRIDELLEDWMFDYVDDSLSNLVIGAKKQVRASSQHGGHSPGRAFDGLQSTGWLCKADDQDPKLTVEFSRPIRADRFVLSHVAGNELTRGQFDRATRVEVDLGGKREPLVFDVDPDEALKTTLTLPRVSRLSTVTFRVLERVDGKKHKGLVGFAEVEFRNGEEKSRRRRK